LSRCYGKSAKVLSKRHIQCAKTVQLPHLDTLDRLKEHLNLPHHNV
jgi:hypothetical protein